MMNMSYLALEFLAKFILDRYAAGLISIGKSIPMTEFISTLLQVFSNKSAVIIGTFTSCLHSLSVVMGQRAWLGCLAAGLSSLD